MSVPRNLVRGYCLQVGPSPKPWHTPAMSESRTHPYVLGVQPASKPGTFQWAIRKHGKLAQRSDKTFRSEDDARKDGEKAVERQFSDAQSTR